MGGDQKKVVPESGTQRGTGNRQRPEESCTGIRYAGRIWEQAACGRKLYRNPVRQGGSGNRQRMEAHQKGAFFVRQKRKSGADNMSKNQTMTDRNGIIILSKEVGKPLIIK